MMKKNLYDNHVQDIVLMKYSPIPRGDCFSEKSIFENDITTCDLSIVVPCYNAEKYLESCLESICQQKTSISYEVIAINDGSKDHTGDILEKYKKWCSQLKIITQENRGYSEARNSGIRTSLGKYLMFIDSDDYISSNYIEELMRPAKDKDLDIVACGYETFRDSRVIKKVRPKGNEDREMLNGCFWGKVFRRELFSQIMLPEGYWYEDSILAHLIYPRVSTYQSVKECFYAYRSNPQGITIMSIGKPKALDTFYITNLMLNTVDKVIPKGFLTSQAYYELLLEQFYLNQRRLIKAPQEVQKKVFEYQKDFINQSYARYYTDKWNRKAYERAIKSDNYPKAHVLTRFDKVYKAAERLIRKREKMWAMIQ